MVLKLLWLSIIPLLSVNVLAQNLVSEDILQEWVLYGNKRSTNVQCNEPDGNKLQTQWMEESGSFCNHHSFRSVLPFQQLEELSGKAASFSTKRRRSSEGSQCSLKSGITFTRERSHCPWHIVTSTNTSRYPRDLEIAELMCSSHDNCLNSSGGRMPTYKCEAVYMDVPVLVNSGSADKQGFCSYKSQHEKVPVGFTCTHAKVSNSPLYGGKREDLPRPPVDSKRCHGYEIFG